MNVAADHRPGDSRWFARAGAGLRAGLTAFLVLAAPLPAFAADVDVKVDEVHGVYHVEGAFAVALPPALAWNVLADYEHIGAFVSSVRRSTFVPTPGGGRRLQQDAVTGAFPFRRTVRVELALTEEPQQRIGFRDELGRDFRQYAGAWTLRPAAGGTDITYELDAEPRSSIPALMVRGAIAHSARDLLTQVRAEMQRRAAAGGDAAH